MISDEDIDLSNCYVDGRGYVIVRGLSSIRLHKYVVEKTIGRELKQHEVIHHINYDKTDNRRCNLLLCPNQAYHKLVHARTDAINSGVDLNIQHKCSSCKEVKTKDSFNISKTRWNGLNEYCKVCRSIKGKEQVRTKIYRWRQSLMQQYRRLRRYSKGNICWIPDVVSNE